jgi:SAM-dependent methyltransferase
MRSRSIKLNLGCGSRTPADWENVDYALGARLAKLPGFGIVNARLRLFDLAWARRIRIHDLRKPFPWPADHADVIYSSHTFEHLTREQGSHFLREAHRVLKPGGILRLVVPDLAHIVAQYHTGGLPADRFIEALDVLTEHGRSGWKASWAALTAFPHKCMYDEAALVAACRRHGFDVRGRTAHNSAIDDIGVVELAERTIHAVIVEGIKVPPACGTASR